MRLTLLNSNQGCLSRTTEFVSDQESEIECASTQLCIEGDSPATGAAIWKVLHPLKREAVSVGTGGPVSVVTASFNPLVLQISSCNRHLEFGIFETF